MFGDIHPVEPDLELGLSSRDEQLGPWFWGWFLLVTQPRWWGFGGGFAFGLFLGTDSLVKANAKEYIFS